MTPYQSFHANSGISAYDIIQNGIIIQFKDGETYLYDEEKPGAQHIAHMKALAAQGKGLTTYINQHVRTAYRKKL